MSKISESMNKNYINNYIYIINVRRISKGFSKIIKEKFFLLFVNEETI